LACVLPPTPISGGELTGRPALPYVVGVEVVALQTVLEIPELAEARSAEDGELARRRIAWYRRQGAFVLEGVKYLQELDTGVPSIPMLLMLHPRTRLDVKQGFSLAKELLPDALQQAGPLRLT
jgi:hypothetical protein